MNEIHLAFKLISEVFNGRNDKGGEPYIFHLIEVERSVRNYPIHVRAAALLHDVIEDITYINENDLIEYGFSFNTVNLVKILTKRDDMSYDDYIKYISLNKEATVIKLADLKHNSDLTRLKGVTSKDLDRLSKYAKSYNYLNIK